MNKQIISIRRWLVFFIAALFLSGLTAIPLEAELDFLGRCFTGTSMMSTWISKVSFAVTYINKHYPFLSYGYDWLAFAHFMLAILFIGPYRDPVRNKWVLEFGMIACVLVVPFAWIAGHYRDIPVGWRLIDCSFGVIGIIPLLICYRKINQLELLLKTNEDVYPNV